MTLLNFASHNGAEADQGRVAASLGGDENLLAATSTVAAATRSAAAATDVTLALAEFVTAEPVKFFKTEILCFVTKLQEGFETLGTLGRTATETRRAWEGRVGGRRAQVGENV